MKESAPQPNPIKAAGIRDWLIAARDEGVLSAHEVDALIQENETKGRLLERYELPTFAVYGPCESLDKVAELIPEEIRSSQVQRFLVRCAPKRADSGLHIERNMDIPWENVVEFVHDLPGGAEQYTVEIREHWKADYAGAIIGNGEGKILMEMIKGDLVSLDKKSSSEMMEGRYDAGQSDIRFHYTDDMTENQRGIMIGALKHVLPELTRESLEKLRIYLEFAYHKDNGYRFLDISERNFWTTL